MTLSSKLKRIIEMARAITSRIRRGKRSAVRMPEELKRMNEIAAAIIAGEQVDLTCPYCGSAQLIFSFAVRERPLHGPKYSLFIECTNCKRRHHSSLTEKPPGFRKELVLPQYQRIEDEISEQVEEQLKQIFRD